MSEENIEIANRGWEAWLQGDVDAAFESWHPAIVWDVSHYRHWPETAYVGIEGSKRFAAEWLEFWDDYEVGVEKTLAAPDGRVISLMWQRGKGRGSGLEVYFETAMIFTFSEGKVIRLDVYDDREAALEATGLSE